MPSKPADRTSDKANPHSGTMVNMGLRGNGRPEFFLYGHEGRLGTSSPCLVRHVFVRPSTTSDSADLRRLSFFSYLDSVH